MEVLITGAGGFIGRALVARLRAGATVRDAQGRLVRPQRLVLCDVEPGSSDDQAFGGIVSGQGPHDGKGLPEGKCGAGAMAEVGDTADAPVQGGRHADLRHRTGPARPLGQPLAVVRSLA